jgi:putative ABC transport system ATP-binding protein
LSRELLIEINGLTKIREKGGVSFELQVPQLDIRPGEFIAVVGPSGCGKSTLLDFLALVLRPTAYGAYNYYSPAGRFDLGSLNEKGLANVRRSELGYVLQSGGLLPYLTVADNILLPARLNGLPLKLSKKYMVALAERLGIAGQLSKKPAHLSGGQRQRAAIARALIHRPRLVLADEPTAAVDFPTAKEICAIFRELTQTQGQALVMVSHDLNLVRQAADRFITFQLQRSTENHTVSVAGERGFRDGRE